MLYEPRKSHTFQELMQMHKYQIFILMYLYSAIKHVLKSWRELTCCPRKQNLPVEQYSFTE